MKLTLIFSQFNINKNRNFSTRDINLPYYIIVTNIVKIHELFEKKNECSSANS